MSMSIIKKNSIVEQEELFSACWWPGRWGGTRRGAQRGKRQLGRWPPCRQAVLGKGWQATARRGAQPAAPLAKGGRRLAMIGGRRASG